MSKLKVYGSPGKAVQECCVLIFLLQDSAEWEALVADVNCSQKLKHHFFQKPANFEKMTAYR